jgi:hypothetical protein
VIDLLNSGEMKEALETEEDHWTSTSVSSSGVHALLSVINKSMSIGIRIDGLTTTLVNRMLADCKTEWKSQ